MSKRRVLVLNAPNVPFSDPSILIEPIDVLTVATWIRQLGYVVQVCDMDREQMSPQEVERVLDSWLADVVVIPFDYHIPLYTGHAIPGVAAMVEIAADRGIQVVVGGRPAKHYPERFLVNQNVVVIDGEMELAVTELLALAKWDSHALARVRGIVYRDGDQLIHTKRRVELVDMNILPTPDRALLDVDQYIDVRTMLSSRGCVEKCRFCPVHTFWGRWRRRSPVLVVDEIAYLVREFAAEKILFLDDHTTVNSKRMREISEEIVRRRIEVSLGCLGTPRAFDRETTELMYGAGFRGIHYGAESGSQRVLDSVNKSSTVELIRRAVLESKEIGVRVRTSWILDAPNSTASDLQDTIDLILELEPDEVRAHYLCLRAGSPYSEQFAGSQDVTRDQYIHSAAPYAMRSAIADQEIISRSSYLSDELAKRGYLVVSDPSDWDNLGNSANSDRQTRFISFCPGRYGIGWELAA